MRIGHADLRSSTEAAAGGQGRGQKDDENGFLFLASYVFEVTFASIIVKYYKWYNSPGFQFLQFRVLQKSMWAGIQVKVLKDACRGIVWLQKNNPPLIHQDLKL